MRFAILGDHPDGLEMARALAESGRHELVVYSGPALGMEILERWGLKAVSVGDLEEILADPSIELLIVASRPALRPAQLRRAIQSERHVLCVHPADRTPDTAYEAALMLQDTGKILLPLLPEAQHPALHRFRELAVGIQRNEIAVPKPEFAENVTAVGLRRSVSVKPMGGTTSAATPSCLLGIPLLLTTQRSLTGPLTEEDVDRPAGLPGWDALRAFGGEVAEIMALSPDEELDPDKPLLFSGRFMSGLLFQGTYFPRQVDPRWILELQGTQGTLRLDFPDGWPGAARLIYRDLNGEEQVEEWPAHHPWTALVETLESEVARQGRRAASSSDAALTWQDAVRSLELDDAVRRSVLRRRASTLDFQDVTEEATFKGAMTLVGCSLLWISLMLLILSAWVPWLGWLILPVFGVFLALQFLGYAVPQKSLEPPATDPAKKSGPDHR